MQVRLTAGAVAPATVDLIACFAFEGGGAECVPDAATRRLLARRAKDQGFRGTSREILRWDGTTGRTVVLGLGPRAEVTAETLRVGCARAVREAAALAASRVAVLLPRLEAIGAADVGRAAVEGLRLGVYQFDRHLADLERRRTVPRRVALHTPLRVTAAMRRAVARGEAAAGAVALARDLVNEGPSRMDPLALARAARVAARGAGLSCRVLDLPRLRRLGLHALLAVARGSAAPPAVVHLTYKPPRASRERVVLVGKGVTFDSGGLNLKPGDSMLTMKSDMAGAAAVLATMTALPRLGCRVEVHALLGLVENMTGGAAYKPGDILQTYARKTVEIGNTDAEGRLVLCDLLAWAAKRLRPTRVVDVATLTGACVVALGQRAAGLFSRDDELAAALLGAATRAGEKLWRLPLYEEYLQLLQKGPADLCNVGGRWGGAITAALFLGEFVPRGLPWAHIDIAGPAFTETDLPDAAIGGTGAAVLTLARWLEAGA